MPFWGFGTKTSKRTQKKKNKPSAKKRASARFFAGRTTQANKGKEII